MENEPTERQVPQEEIATQLELLDGASYAELIRSKEELADYFAEEDLAELSEFGPGDEEGDAMNFIYSMLMAQGVKDPAELLRQLDIFE